MDLRKNKKVISTLRIKDEGQDFTELDVLEDGIILGNSPIFSHGRMSMIGIGSLNGNLYFTLDELLKNKFKLNLENLFIYTKATGEKDPLPWNATTLNYPVIEVKKPVKPNRFIKR